MKKNKIALWLTTLLITQPSSAGIMRHDTFVQDYRDFAENLGKYRIGATDIAVYKKNGELDAHLNFIMPDLSSTSTRGFTGLTAPSYVSSVRHVKDLKSVFFGNYAEFSKRYNFVSRNAIDDSINQDYMLPRLAKVVTEVAPVEHVDAREFRAGIGTRYTAFVRAGSGAQKQINDQLDGLNSIAGAYTWLSGGTINPAIITTDQNYLYWVQYNPDDPRSSPLSIASQSGDSGSPVFAYDSVDKKWKLVAANMGRAIVQNKYGTKTKATLLPDGHFASIIAARTSPDVVDANLNDAIYWNSTTISQDGKFWDWQGLDEKYRDLAPANASLSELDASKDLRFNGAGGDIVLNDSVNLGAGKLQFSNDYSVKSAAGAEATWAGGGVEIDRDKTVLWQVNGVADDDLHKIGAGMLHINATGKNLGGISVGDGTVILDQQADASGNRQAFSRLFIVSGRPTVVLNSADQVAANNIFFGYRGGKLGLNGNALQMRSINHTDSGAWLINSNQTRAAELTLRGYQSSNIKIHEWVTPHIGVVGDIYEDYNPKSKRIEYFQLKTPDYSYFPTNQQDNKYWKYIGFDALEAQQYRSSQLNDLVFRGYLGAGDASEPNGVINVNFSPELSTSKLAFTGGFNLNGDVNVTRGTVLLSGQPVPHAGGVIVEGDWLSSSFHAKQIAIADDARFQVGEYAQVKADMMAGDRSQIQLGYNQSLDAQQQILRCTASFNQNKGICSAVELTDEQRAALPASVVHGDITLGDNASLYLGKVEYRGALQAERAAAVTLESDARWNLTASSRVKQLKSAPQAMISLLSNSETRWTPKQLWVDHLDASQLQLALGIAPTSGLNDSLYIDQTASGGSNTLDVSFMLDEKLPESVPNTLVLLDTPRGTAHDYFTLPALKRGFSVYTPNYQVVEADGRVKWVMLATPKPVIKPEPVIEPEPEIKPEPIVKPEPVTKPQPVIEPLPGHPGNWFVIGDNQPLLRSTRDMLATRDYLFSEVLAGMHDRTQALRQTDVQRGAWVNVSHDQGGVRGVNVRQQTLSLGVDNGHYGVMASYAKGAAKASGAISHQLSSIGTYATWQAPSGYFIDLAASFMHLRQNLQLDSGLAISHTQRNSKMLAASAKTGYALKLAQDRWALTPYLQLASGYQSGYALEGDDVRIGLSSATPWALTPGFELKGQPVSGLMLHAGVSRSFTPGNKGARLTLEDRQASRVYGSLRDERYRLKLGISGKMAENWMFNLGSQRSFSGTFRTDLALNGGIAYQF